MKFCNRKAMPLGRRGFTLVELLIVIAMIAILASAILVTLSTQREKARASKAILELSGAIQPMMLCFSDGGTINNPSNGGVICKINGSNKPSYGTWPDLSDIGGAYGISSLGSSGSWNYRATVEGVTILCSSDNSKCEEL